MLQKMTRSRFTVTVRAILSYKIYNFSYSTIADWVLWEIWGWLVIRVGRGCTDTWGFKAGWSPECGGGVALSPLEDLAYLGVISPILQWVTKCTGRSAAVCSTECGWGCSDNLGENPSFRDTVTNPGLTFFAHPGDPCASDHHVSVHSTPPPYVFSPHWRFFDF